MSGPTPLEIQLAVLDSKLDGIKTTLDVRLNHIEERITANAAEIKSVERHGEAGRVQQADAFSKLLERKTDKIQSEERYIAIIDRVGKIEDTHKKLNWAVTGAIISALLASAMGGGAIYQNNQSKNPPSTVAHPR